MATQIEQGLTGAAGLLERVKDRWWVHCAPSADALALLSRFAKDPAGFDDGVR